MAKPVINYKGYMSENPADRTGAKICIPQIVEKGADDVAFRSSEGAFSVHRMQSQTPIRFTRGSASD